ncbi:hypothetical protein C2G38_2241743 [Gigaspora rosea]|uniref:HCP-like protein n=1 Tax=Gigaspora rosea TaxID=44941 RepID=A0A397VU46_9GLOM|nr:hypothetical protein C2G38_2241743 [Gigaspora rosea]
MGQILMIDLSLPDSSNTIELVFKNYQTNSTIQLVLASCYRFGKWVEKDEHKAFNYYQKLAEMNNSHRILFLGVCYTNGIRVEKDKLELKKNERKAFIYYQKSEEMENATEMRDASGTYNVGVCYRDGIEVEKGEGKAFAYFQKSAEMGDAEGTGQTGLCYFCSDARDQVQFRDWN